MREFGKESKEPEERIEVPLVLDELITTFTCVECGEELEIESSLCGHWEHEDICERCCDHD